MRIRIINPNTSESFTQKNIEVGAAVAAAGTDVTGSQPAGGAPSIEDHYDEAVAAIGIIEEVLRGERDGIDGYVIACFGDPGVAAAREIARGPVVGMSEAAVHMATLVADSFSIVTLPARTRIHAERMVREVGATHHCRSIRAIDVPVLELEDEEWAEMAALTEECRRAVAEDGAEAIVLGCAGLADRVQPLRDHLKVPVIEGVAAAVKLVEAMVTLGIRTSKIRSFDYPTAKSFTGSFEPLSPSRLFSRLKKSE